MKTGNQQLGTNDYLVEQDPNAEKKKKIMIGGGIFALFIALILVFTSGGGAQPGQAEMKAALEPLSEALAITTSYDRDLSYTPTRNGVAQVKTLLRSSYPELNELYNTTYKPNSKFSANPRPSKETTEILDGAARTNTIDSEIVVALEAKLNETLINLQKAKAHFTKTESLETIDTAREDISSALGVLNSL